MAQRTTFDVPTEQYIEQAGKSLELLKAESKDGLAALARVGIGKEFTSKLDSTTALVTEKAQAVAKAIVVRGKEVEEREDAIAEAVAWMNHARGAARLAFGRNDRRYRRFRPGKLRSHRIGPVARELRLLLLVADRFKEELAARGFGREQMENGAKAAKALWQEDWDAAAATELVGDAASELEAAEKDLSDLLTELEDAGSFVFESGRYRLDALRDYGTGRAAKKKDEQPEKPAEGGEA